MESKTKTAGKTARVVLNLTLEQAKSLKEYLYYSLGIGEKRADYNLMESICRRIEKTINKHEMPKKALSCRDNFATEQEAMEMPGDVMEAITQATQDAEIEMFQGAK